MWTYDCMAWPRIPPPRGWGLTLVGSSCVKRPTLFSSFSGKLHSAIWTNKSILGAFVRGLRRRLDDGAKTPCGWHHALIPLQVPEVRGESDSIATLSDCSASQLACRALRALLIRSCVYYKQIACLRYDLPLYQHSFSIYCFLGSGYILLESTACAKMPQRGPIPLDEELGWSIDILR